jgi:hypothetical protein
MCEQPNCNKLSNKYTFLTTTPYDSRMIDSYQHPFFQPPHYSFAVQTASMLFPAKSNTNAA